MEIIKIGRDSFKISLNSKEALEYELVGENAKSDISKSVRVLIDTLKREEKIAESEDALSAEVYISRDGGCEVFVSRSTSDKVTSREMSRHSSRVIYRFRELKALLNACSVLIGVEYGGACEVYFDKNRRSYYLCMSGVNPKDLSYASLAEHGERLKSSIYPYIREYCEEVFNRNSLDFFAKLI